jgi:CUG-BP- and ETR3-like factor
MVTQVVSGVLRSKVFIGCIPSTVEENEVRSEIGKSGKLIGFFYCKDQSNISDRGIAFCTFSNEAEANKCIESVNGVELFPNSIRALQAKLLCEKIVDVDSTSVFVDSGSLLPSTSWEEYTSDEGHPYYYNKATGETVWDKPQYYTPIPQQSPTNALLLSGAATLPPPGSLGIVQNSGYGPLGANLFVFHIPADWKDEELREKFESYGDLVSCRVAVEETGRSRGFGFVSYTTRESAANAMQGMSGYPVGGKYLKVTVKQGEAEYAVAPTIPAIAI